jgi:DNA-3-methyladenine glycosylase II
VGVRVSDDGADLAATLRGQSRDRALAQLQTLPDIGPFSAELVLLRGAGDPDAFPVHEHRLHRAMAAAYHLGNEATLDTLRRVSDRWRPYRTWVAFLLRVWLEDQTTPLCQQCLRQIGLPKH